MTQLHLGTSVWRQTLSLCATKQELLKISNPSVVPMLLRILRMLESLQLTTTYLIPVDVSLGDTGRVCFRRASCLKLTQVKGITLMVHAEQQYARAVKNIFTF